MYVDPRIKSASATRSKRSFKFHEAGKYVKQAKKIRTKVNLLNCVFLVSYVIILFLQCDALKMDSRILNVVLNYFY